MADRVGNYELLNDLSECLSQSIIIISIIIIIIIIIIITI
jgi:hypothetical protein